MNLLVKSYMDFLKGNINRVSENKIFTNITAKVARLLFSGLGARISHSLAHYLAIGIEFFETTIKEICFAI